MIECVLACLIGVSIFTLLLGVLKTVYARKLETETQKRITRVLQTPILQ